MSRRVPLSAGISLSNRVGRRIVAIGIVAVLALLLFPRFAAAQPSSAALSGVVIDASGQPFPDARIRLLDGLGLEVTTVRGDDDGRFVLEDVAPGTYTLSAEAPGWQSEAQVLTVSAAFPLVVELRMTPRHVESLVVESGQAPTVVTRTTLSGTALREMPTRLQSRSLQHALATLPGWSSEDNGLLHVRGIDDGFLFVRDGMPIYDRIDPLFGVAPDPSGLGAIHVMTGYIPAEFGLKSGAVVEVQSAIPVRRSWTGQLSGGIGSEATGSAYASGGGPLGKRAVLGVSANAERSDRFLDPVHPDNFHNDGRVWSGDAHLTLTPVDGDLVRVNADVGHLRYDVPHGAAQEAVGQDQEQRLGQDAQSISWQRSWSSSTISQAGFYRRRVDADLLPSLPDTPITASSDRRHGRLGFLASLTHQRGDHTFKAGLETARLDLREHFSFAVTDPELAEEAEISDAAARFTPDAPFTFADRVRRAQWSFYVQDTFRASDRLTIQAGVRFDRTRLLVPASQWSPRVGAAFRWPSTDTTVRASINRLFQPPQPEHLLLSSSPEARALSPFAEDDEESGGAPIEPERQTAWELGVEQWIGGVLRVDAAIWRRSVRNYGDPNVFFGTTIVFPNSVARGRARGFDLRVEVPRVRGWSLYGSYTHANVLQFGPINGGLFLEDEVIEIGPGTPFVPDHDQRHVVATGLTYTRTPWGLSVSLTGRYESGTPLEVEEDEVPELMERPGAELVDFDRLRVRPRTVLDLAVSKVLRRDEPRELSLGLSVTNLFGERYALNFGNPFSGTHFGAPRTFLAELRLRL